MNHPLTVRMGKRVGNLDRVANDLIERQRTAPNPLGQRVTLKVLHDDEVNAILIADVVNSTNVRVVDLRDGARLTGKALGLPRIA